MSTDPNPPAGLARAEQSFDADIVRFLCRRAGARNWIEQERAVVVAWTAEALSTNATVTRRNGDYLVHAGELTMVFRPHERAHVAARGPSAAAGSQGAA